MSAKEFYHKNDPPYIPYLPPELWTTIIRHATWVPGRYDPELTTLAFSLSANMMNKERLDKWKKALITRRNLVRVNKTWYTLAVPFLYEYILLGRGRTVSPLLYAMQGPQHGTKSENTSRPTLGWWTKRLDINFWDSTSNPEADMDALADLLTYMPNLRVLTFSITGTRYKELLPARVLSSVSCRETLKFIHFYMLCLPSSDIWNLFLERHPYLESANLNDCLFDARFDMRLDFLQTMHLDINTKYLNGASSEDPSWYTNYPAIRAAAYDLHFTNIETHGQQFFTRFGPKLKTIQLTQLHALPEADHGEFETTLDATFDWILSECPALEQVNLVFRSWWMLTRCAPHFPSEVATVVIRVTIGQVSKKKAVQLFHELFVTMKDQNPNLKAIQFASGMNVVRGLRTHPKVLTEGLRCMNDIGLVIKDDEGHPMV